MGLAKFNFAVCLVWLVVVVVVVVLVVVAVAVAAETRQTWDGNDVEREQ